MINIIDCILGIDAGTTMTKVVAFDFNGNELAIESKKTKVSNPCKEWIESDLDIVWDSVKSCIDGILSQIKNNYIVKAIGITSTGDGTWLLDKNLKPIRPGIMWCDGRAGPIVSGWHESGIGQKVYDLCGTVLFAGSQAPQLKWLIDNESEIIDKAEVIFHEKDWLFYKLTGEISTDDSDESLTMIDLYSREYDTRLFEIFSMKNLMDKFPTLRRTKDNYYRILPTLAERWGLDKQVIVSAGPMDVQAHALGVGAIKVGQASSVMGTAGLHSVVMDDPNINHCNPSGMTLCHLIQNRWLRLVAAMIATPNLNWILNLFGHTDSQFFNYEEYAKEKLESIPIGSNGVMYHPYLYPGGERGPILNTEAKASFIGLSQLHDKEHLIRSVYEGVAFSTNDCIKSMPIEPYVVLLSGGGSNSHFWSQMIADVLGIPVSIPSGTEFGAKGASINAAVASGIYPDYEAAVGEMISEARHHIPDSSRHIVYQEYYGLYKQFRETQSSIWKKRAELELKYSDLQNRGSKNDTL